MREHILRNAEKRSSSIYGMFRTAHKPDTMQKLVEDRRLALAHKFTAILAAYAHFQVPCSLAAFRNLIPDAFWDKHFCFRYTKYGQGPSAAYIDINKNEMFYLLEIGPGSSPYGLHAMEFVSTEEIMPKNHDFPGGIFHPPMDAPVFRFALIHPFIQYELHDQDGTYLLSGA